MLTPSLKNINSCLHKKYVLNLQHFILSNCWIKCTKSLEEEMLKSQLHSASRDRDACSIGPGAGCYSRVKEES